MWKILDVIIALKTSYVNPNLELRNINFYKLSQWEIPL